MNGVVTRLVAKICATDSKTLHKALSRYYQSTKCKRGAPALIDQTHCLISDELIAFGVPYELAHNYYREDLLISADPTLIVGYVPGRVTVANESFRTKFSFIARGEWDANPQLFSAHPKAIEMAELLNCDGVYQETDSYTKKIDEMTAGSPGKHHGVYLDTIDKIDAYYARYLDIVESMKNVGYQSQRSLDDSDGEIGVAIGRHGELLALCKGHHRLAIARLLELDQVLASVRLIHHEWVYQWTSSCGKPPHQAIRMGLSELRNHESLEPSPVPEAV